jgi:uncharacterized membrane protein
MLSAYAPPEPASAAWVTAAASLDDIATLFLAAALVWYAFERLRAVRIVDSFLRSVDAALRTRRKAFERWGTLALALFLWLPGIGTGPVLSAGMGVVGGIRLRRLLPALSVSALAVNAFWAYSIAGTVQLLPDAGVVELLAPLLIAVLALLLAFGLWRQSRRPPIIRFEALTERTFADAVRLTSLGYSQIGRTFRVDARDLARHTGLDPGRVAEVHWAARLLLLPSMRPEMAGRLASLGVSGRRDLLLLSGDTLAEALDLPPDTGPALVARWKQEAHEQMETTPPDLREE